MRTTSLVCGVYLSALSVCTLGCGDDGDGDGSPASFPESTTCGLALETHGALKVDLGVDSGAACLVSSGYSRVIDAGFLFVNGEPGGVGIQVLSIDRGETGTFPGVVTIESREGAQWESEECMVTITEHELVGPAELERDQYRVTGSFRCRSAAPESDDAPGSLEIDALSFVVTVAWESEP